jgi:hypothetical protein
MGPAARTVAVLALLWVACLVGVAQAGRFIDFPTSGRTNKVPALSDIAPPSFFVFIFVVFVLSFFDFSGWLAWRALMHICLAALRSFANR